jgi:hypothetical protein
MILGYSILFGSVMSGTIPLALAWTRRRVLNQTLSIIISLIALSLTVDTIMVCVGFSGINNMPLAHAYGLIEGILLLTFFSRLLSLPKRGWINAIIAYSVLYCLNSAFHEDIFTFNSHARTTEALMMLMLSVYALYRFYTKEEDIFIEKSPEFWMVIAILVYFSGALFSFLLSTEILSERPERFYSSWILHNTSNSIKNILFAVGIWKVKA